MSDGASGGGYRGAEQLRQVLIELKMVPVRKQVGIPYVWEAFDETGGPRNAALDGAIKGMVTEVLWWATALIPARERDHAVVGA